MSEQFKKNLRVLNTLSYGSVIKFNFSALCRYRFELIHKSIGSLQFKNNRDSSIIMIVWCLEKEYVIKKKTTVFGEEQWVNLPQFYQEQMLHENSITVITPSYVDKYTVKVPHIVSDETVKDLLVTALEGGSNYWIEDIKKHKKTKPLYDMDAWGWHITITTEEGSHIITESKLEKALQDIHDEYPAIWQNIIDETYDAGDADVWFQYATLGKVIYG